MTAKTTLIQTIVFSTIFCTFLAWALMHTQLTIRNVGTVVTINIDAYEDPACTTPLTFINWSQLWPGSSKNYTFYLKNNGNINVTLTLQTGNWTPANTSQFLTLTWNLENKTVTIGEVVTAQLELAVSTQITDIEEFSFDIIITGEEIE